MSAGEGSARTTAGDDLLVRLCDAYVARALAAVEPDAILPLYAARLLPRWRSRAPGEPAAIPALEARARDAVAPELADFVFRCGAALADVLRGDIDPMELYLRAETTTFLYETSPVARKLNGAVAALLLAAAPARVLEIGAGTGGTTRAALAALRPRRYLFTDVSSTLLRRARRRLGDDPCLDFARFDVEQDPAAQGLEPATFDAVVAANALHAARDVDAALAHAAALLAPGGVLLLWEAEREETWFDVTFALLPGWHRHDDRHRRGSPLLEAARWQERARAAGLAASAAVLTDNQAAIVARRAG